VRLARAALVFALAAACAGPEPGARPEAKRGDELQTVDVTAAPDAEASLESDRHEPPVGGGSPGGRGGGIAGALPEGFPADVPLPRPSSLVDFDARSITLEVAGAVEGVRTAYVRQLQGAGFAAREAGRWQRGSRSLRIGFEPFGGATRVRIEIVPAS
jgi:hypothetical protein